MVSCNTTTSTKKVNDVDIFVGTDGLVAEFSKNAPPPRVFEDSSFPILLRIRNIGAYSIASDKQTFGMISIGRERDYVPALTAEKNNRVLPGTTDNEIFFSVDGKTKINTKGDEIIASLNAKTGKLDPQSEQKLSTITANLCYPYKTVLSTTVCIDPDVSGIRPGKKVCNVKEIIFNNGQGAPIAITKIEPNMIPDGDIIKPQFLVFIENKGKGNPVNINNYFKVCGKEKLSNEEIKNTWNVAFLKAYTSGNQQLECSPNSEGSNDNLIGFLRFRDKKDFVRCTFKDKNIKRSDDAFTSPLRIEIDYGYVQTAPTSFIIQKPLKY